MKIVSKPDPARNSILHKAENPDDPFYKFGGPDSFSCGQCGHILVDKIKQGEISGVYLECPKCHQYNFLE